QRQAASVLRHHRSHVSGRAQARTVRARRPGGSAQAVVAWGGKPSGRGVRQPDFDIDRAKGAQAELWVMDLRKAFAEKARIEVKAPEPFLREKKFYVEYKCRGRDGIWRPSGLSTTKAALQFFKFGSLPGGLIVETEWLKRACKIAY